MQNRRASTLCQYGLWLLCMVMQTAQSQPQLDLTLSATLAAVPNEARGQKIYQQACVRCHQQDAYGVAAQNIPALAGQQYEYLVKQVLDFIDAERVSEPMHRVLKQRNLRSVQALADVLGYVANLPSNPLPATGEGTAIKWGRQLYAQNCVSCHGKTAEGNADLWVPNLRGQHYGYLLQQMQKMTRAQRNNISDDLHRMFMSYADAEFAAMADYLSRWQQVNND